MLFEKHKCVYVLKYMDKYFKVASCVNSPNDILTNDVLEAAKYPFKQDAEITIKNIKNSNPRWDSEIILREIISNCEIKKLEIDLKGCVND